MAVSQIFYKKDIDFRMGNFTPLSQLLVRYGSDTRQNSESCIVAYDREKPITWLSFADKIAGFVDFFKCQPGRVWGIYIKDSYIFSTVLFADKTHKSGSNSATLGSNAIGKLKF